MVMFDLNYFKYCFLKPSGLEFNEICLQEDFERFADDLLSSGDDMVFMHRDCQCRNVMVRDGEPYFIDFQGGRKGPYMYDVASFIWHARSEYPQDLKERMLDSYLEALSAYRKVSRDEFDSKLRLFVLFRTLQVLGAYGFRGWTEHKANFIVCIPQTVASLKDLLHGLSCGDASDLRSVYPYIGFNLVLVPASVSTLGKSSPEGVNMTVTKDSEEKLYRRCVVNNAAYDYISRCSPDDMGISAPPSDLRLWIFNGMEASSAVMLHHGALLRTDLVEEYLGKFSRLIEYFLPDVTIGTKGDDSYASIYSDTCHELAHASHFSQVGTSYWNRYILYVIESYVTSGGMTYGDGAGDGAGYCEIGDLLLAVYLCGQKPERKVLKSKKRSQILLPGI